MKQFCYYICFSLCALSFAEPVSTTAPNQLPQQNQPIKHKVEAEPSPEPSQNKINNTLPENQQIPSKLHRENVMPGNQATGRQTLPVH